MAQDVHVPALSTDFRMLLRRDWPVILTAGFALVWIVHRAVVQSITTDEATTFHYFVEPNSAAYWDPQSNNHVLNSMLMRLTVWLFGLSELTVRLPALLGGTLYIFSVYVFLTGQDCLQLCSPGHREFSNIREPDTVRINAAIS